MPVVNHHLVFVCVFLVSELSIDMYSKQQNTFYFLDVNEFFESAGHEFELKILCADNRATSGTGKTETFVEGSDL